MDLKKIFDKIHDRVAPPSSIKPSPMNIQQRRSLEEKKFTKLSKWRGKWGNVAKSRIFSSNKKGSYTTDISYSSSINEPTITLSSPTVLQRPHSTIDHVSQLDYLHQQRPTSCTPISPRTKQSRLSVPYVVDHLRSMTPLDVYSSDDTSSFYNAPLLPPPPAQRRSTWYPSSYHQHDNNDDDNYKQLDNPTTHSASSTDWIPNDDLDSISNDCHSLVLVGNQATTSTINETSSQHRKADSTSQDDDDPPFVATPCQDIAEERLHYQLVTMNVANTMMKMKEKQQELQMEELRMKYQQLEQQMEDVVSGTWASTTQLIEENDRLESQIRQLQQQQRRIKSSPINGNGGGEPYLLDEQEALRHTRAQLGLVEYLEGEPDVMAALNRFKKLLASSC